MGMTVLDTADINLGSIETYAEVPSLRDKVLD